MCDSGCGVCHVTHKIESLGLLNAKFFVSPSHCNLQPLVDARCGSGTRQIHFIRTGRSIDDHRPKAATPEDSAAATEKNRRIETRSKIKSLEPAPPHTSGPLGHHREVLSSRPKPAFSGGLFSTSALAFAIVAAPVCLKCVHCCNFSSILSGPCICHFFAASNVLHEHKHRLSKIDELKVIPVGVLPWVHRNT
jgi:hypothetical protein